jgi:hypothetical protein
MEASEVRGALEDGWPELASMLADHDADSLTSGLSYLEMAAVVRFLAEKLRTGDIARFPAFFQAVERCLHDGDERAVQLVVVGLLEDLQNGSITARGPLCVVPFLGAKLAASMASRRGLLEGRRGRPSSVLGSARCTQALTRAAAPIARSGERSVRRLAVGS